VISHVDNSRHRLAQGSALVETALVMSVALLFMLASIRMSIVGFYQISADAAAFFEAHSSALQGSCQGGAVGSSIFNRVPNGSYSCVTLAGQNVNVPVTGYNFSSTTQRFGGYSTMQGSQVRTTIDSTAGSIGLLPGNPLVPSNGAKATVHAEVIEPRFDEYGVHYNADGDLNGLGSFQHGVNYFTGGENTPPYFTGYRIMRFCGDPLFDSTTHVPTPWSQCGNVQWHGLGLGEELDSSNWAKTSPGVSKGSTFEYALCHQQLYAQFVNLLATTYASALPTAAQAYQDFNPARAGSLLAKIYAQDNIQTSIPNWASNVGDFPTHPESGCP
jgi:hypothetical protein